MRKASFKITGLHCAEEIALLKKVVGEQKGVELLDFDLLQAKMSAEYREEIISSDHIIKLVKSTGMSASPWDEKGFVEEKAKKIKRLKSLFTLLSGLLLFTGAFIQFFSQRSFEALFGSFSEASSSNTPLIAILCYLLSMGFGGFFIFPKAYYAIKRLRPDMNLLMVIAALGALLIQEWFEGATVTFLFSVALMLEEWSLARARRAIEALLNVAPPFARVLKEGKIDEVPVEDVPLKSHVEIRPGDKIPLDGLVVEGSSSVNQAPITGESVPVSKEVGDELYAGSINEEGRLVLETTKRAQDTTLARIIQMIEESHAKRAASEQWVEKFAKVYTPLMIALALCVLIIPPLFFGGSWTSWLYRALVVLVVACPCALVISTPVSIVAALTSSAKEGVLIKGGRYLELMGSLRALALDKTGTLTLGHPEVQKIIPLSGHTEDELLMRAAALEQPSSHPLAKAVMKKAGHLTLPPVKDYELVKGKGAEGTINGKRYWIGSHRFMHEKGQETEEVHQKALNLEDAGHSIIAIGNESHICGLLSVADEVREGMKETLVALKNAGLEKVVMMTGDNAPTAEAIAKLLEISEYYAEMLPEDKVKGVQHLVEKYGYVGMIGDGINDAPAMAAASIGIAMGAVGTDVAIETADVALMSDDLARVPWLIRHSKRTLGIIKQNIAFALALKALFIFLALFGLASLWMAIAADTGAALLVIFNGLRLLKP